jgi:hypothetical protein
MLRDGRREVSPVVNLDDRKVARRLRVSLELWEVGKHGDYAWGTCMQRRMTVVYSGCGGARERGWCGRKGGEGLKGTKDVDSLEPQEAARGRGR